MYYLKTAYIETMRYSEPKFELTLPKLPDQAPIDVLEIDMRSDITGSNWWFVEPAGRWAGPENESTLFIPTLGAGYYRIEINITSEIVPGVIDTTNIAFNRNPITVKRSEAKLPTKLLIEVQVEETYHLPFWSLKFYFQKLASPQQFGSTDTRMLAIYVNSVRITRVSI